MLNKAHEAAINNGAPMTTKRVSIIESPFLIFIKRNIENNINIQLYYCTLVLYMKFEIFLRNINSKNKLLLEKRVEFEPKNDQIKILSLNLLAYHNRDVDLNYITIFG